MANETIEGKPPVGDGPTPGTHRIERVVEHGNLEDGFDRHVGPVLGWTRSCRVRRSTDGVDHDFLGVAEEAHVARLVDAVGGTEHVGVEVGEANDVAREDDDGSHGVNLPRCCRGARGAAAEQARDDLGLGSGEVEDCVETLGEPPLVWGHSGDLLLGVRRPQGDEVGHRLRGQRFGAAIVAKANLEGSISADAAAFDHAPQVGQLLGFLADQRCDLGATRCAGRREVLGAVDRVEEAGIAHGRPLAPADEHPPRPEQVRQERDVGVVLEVIEPCSSQQGEALDQPVGRGSAECRGGTVLVGHVPVWLLWRLVASSEEGQVG